MSAAIGPGREAVGRLAQVNIDVSDLERGAQFWSAILGLKRSREFGQYLEFERQEGSPTIILQKVPEAKTVKNRVHLDIEVDDLDEAVDLCLGLPSYQRRGCFHGLGAWSIKAIYKDPAQLKARCSHGTHEDQLMCIEGVIEKYIYATGYCGEINFVYFYCYCTYSNVIGYNCRYVYYCSGLYRIGSI